MSHCTDIVTISTWTASRVWSIGGIADRLHFIDDNSAMRTPSSASLQRSSSLQYGVPDRSIVTLLICARSRTDEKLFNNKHLRALCFFLFAFLNFFIFARRRE